MWEAAAGVPEQRSGPRSAASWRLSLGRAFGRRGRPVGGRVSARAPQRPPAAAVAATPAPTCPSGPGVSGGGRRPRVRRRRTPLRSPSRTRATPRRPGRRGGRGERGAHPRRRRPSRGALARWPSRRLPRFLPCAGAEPAATAARGGAPAGLGARRPGPLWASLADAARQLSRRPSLRWRRRRDALAVAGRPRREVARRIGRTIPLVYGAAGIAAVAAQRWKTQVNENAKTPAFAASEPELCLRRAGRLGAARRRDPPGALAWSLLRHGGERPAAGPPVRHCRDATDEVMADVIRVAGGGRRRPRPFFDLALLGDLVSLHLAGREGVDPGPAPASARWGLARCARAEPAPAQLLS